MSISNTNTDSFISITGLRKQKRKENRHREMHSTYQKRKDKVSCKAFRRGTEASDHCKLLVCSRATTIQKKNEKEIIINSKSTSQATKKTMIEKPKINAKHIVLKEEHTCN